MPRRRFYASPDEISGSAIRLSRDETHHLTRVLRLGFGEEVFVFDGCGREYRCSFAALEHGRARLEVSETLLDRVEPSTHITLAQALAKGEKFDFIVQKATELGVSAIAPLATAHADVKLSDERSEKRLERWRRISLEAMKQCGRRRVVEIAPPVALKDFLDAVRARDAGASDSGFARTLLVFSERGGAAIADALPRPADNSEVIALVGPEGGWGDEELTLLDERGARAVTLGPRVLRAETAAVVAVTLIQHILGDLSSE
ncbi:MAG TPA: 16S rRNA (uracil(1498)-N(3))-methyltransferase [Blastocatellia bacterium]|jgi:16S rRNA (uracil1498-N3)-methyltransferase|nr:16S rRNA (uracil(1498)-N(3))-methyltransferase [Blastocatellia bacterium]